METHQKLAVSLTEAAEMLSMGKSTLRDKIVKREIAVCRGTRRIIISVDELKRYLARNTLKL